LLAPIEVISIQRLQRTETNMIASVPGAPGAATIETWWNPKLFWSDPGAAEHLNPVRRRLCERAADWFSLQRG
jgi:hypothetical protein